MIPIVISYRDFPSSEAVNAAIQERADKLEEFHRNIISCNVVVSSPHKHHGKGRIFHIQVRVHIPGADIVVNRDPEKDSNHEDIYISIRDAFEAVEKQLKSKSERIRGDEKERHVAPHARVIRIFPQEGYGFIESSDGREIYFHENSVLNGEFEKLEVGTEVRFSEEMGEKGWQVTSMNLIGTNGRHQFQ